MLLILMGVELYNVYKCYAVFNTVKYLFLNLRFESSVKSYDTKTDCIAANDTHLFESSVKSYDTKTPMYMPSITPMFESSVKSYDTKTSLISSMLVR